MTPIDFQLIRNFTQAEVEDTGANIADVQLSLMTHLDAFRDTLNRRVLLLPKGMTTGAHKAVEHAAGLAVDICFCDDQPVDFAHIIYTALDCGFKGIGVYWNGFANSFHLDLGRRRMWGAWKEHGETEWHYYDLFVDPKERMPHQGARP